MVNDMLKDPVDLLCRVENFCFKFLDMVVHDLDVRPLDINCKYHIYREQDMPVGQKSMNEKSEL